VAVFGTLLTINKQWIIDLHYSLALAGILYLLGALLTYFYIKKDTV
jgi:hypothetical protein